MTNICSRKESISIFKIKNIIITFKRMFLVEKFKSFNSFSSMYEVGSESRISRIFEKNIYLTIFNVLHKHLPNGEGMNK